MHSQLKSYLSSILDRLGSLPTARSLDEIREIRQHLQDSVMMYEEFGETEGEAVAHAIEQFGTPDEVGESVLRAWQREERLRRARSYWALSAVLAAAFIGDAAFNHQHLGTDVGALGVALFLIRQRYAQPRVLPGRWAHALEWRPRFGYEVGSARRIPWMALAAVGMLSLGHAAHGLSHGSARVCPITTLASFAIMARLISARRCRRQVRG